MPEPAATNAAGTSTPAGNTNAREQQASNNSTTSNNNNVTTNREQQTNKNSTEPTNSSPSDDQGQNNNNNQTRNQSQNQTRRPAFTGAVTELTALLHRTERPDKGQVMKLRRALEIYVLANFDLPQHIMPVILDLMDPYFSFYAERPTRTTLILELGLNEPLSAEDEEDLKGDLKNEQKLFSEAKQTLKQNMRRLYGLVWGQCSHALQQEIKLDLQYRVKSREQCGLWLLTTVKEITSGIDKRANQYLVTYKLCRDFFNIRQHDNETADEYYERFCHAVDTLKLLGADIAMHQNLIALEGGLYNTDMSEAKFFAMAFILNAHKRYNNLLVQLSNNMLHGTNNYPDTLQAAYELLGRWQSESGHVAADDSQSATRRRRRGGGSGRSTNNNSGRGRGPGRGRGRGASLNQVHHDPQHPTSQPSPSVAGYNGVCIPNAWCSRCQNHGHSILYCPIIPTQSSDTNSDTASITSTVQEVIQNVQFQCAQIHPRIEDILPSLKTGDLLLDSGATHSTIKDKSLVTNLRETTNPVMSYTNTGSRDFNTDADLLLFPITVKYDPHGLANILSMSQLWLSRQFHIHCDSDIEDVLHVHAPNNIHLQFTLVTDGLFILTQSNNKTKAPVTPYTSVSMLSTVAANKRNFTPKEVSLATKARTLRSRIGYPGRNFYRTILRRGSVRNSPVIVDDFNRSLSIYGDLEEHVQGKMTRPTATAFPNVAYVNLPPDIVQHHPTDELEMDFVFIEGIPFHHTYSRKIQYTHVTHAPSRSSRYFIPTAKLHKKYYTKRGFTINRIHVDNEFAPLEHHILPTILERYGRDEHPKAVERNNRTLEERVRCIFHGAPYKRLPKILIIALVETAAYWMNAFPKENGISDTLSPDSILTGAPQIDYNNLDLQWGERCLVRTQTKNDNTARAEEAIALTPTNNRGGWKFMSLVTGQEIHGFHWDKFPITDLAIQKVEALAAKEGMHEIQHSPKFELEPGVDWNDDEQVNNYHSDSDDSDFYNVPNDPKAKDVKLDGFAPDASGDEEIIQHHLQQTNNERIIQQEIKQAQLQVPPVEEATTAHIVNDSELPVTYTSRVTPQESDTITESSEDKASHEVQNLINTIDDITQEIKDDIHQLRSELPQHTDAQENRSESRDNNMETQNTTTEVQTEPIVQDNNNENTSTIHNESDTPNTHAHEDNVPQRDIAPPTDESRSESHDSTSTEQQTNPTHGGLTNTRTSIGLSPKMILPSAVERIRKENSMYSSAEFQMTQIFTKKADDRAEKQRNMYKQTVQVLLTQFEQMHAGKGIKIFGDEAIEALIKEYTQLIDMQVFSRIPLSELTPEMKEMAINTINMIKQKRDLSVKGRMVADGRCQRKYISKEEASSPTLSTEAFFLSLMVDAVEGREVAVFDIPGAYLHADMPKDRPSVLKFTNQYADMVCNADPSFLPDVHYEGKTKVLYVHLDKALYGCMESGLMWYLLYTKVLKGMGFVLNPYDTCVATKMINGHQCTICYYVDDNKISHVDPAVIDDIMQKIADQFGDLKIQRGDNLDFLGMIINQDKKNRRISIDMRSYITQTLNEYEETDKIITLVSTPARKTLFLTRTEDPLLDSVKKEIFHSTVMKLLWISKRGRPDIELGVAFLCTRVQNPTDRDWRKLKRILSFLKRTINDIRYIGADDINHLLAFVDASYGVHPDMRSHTGAVLSFGRGLLHQMSIRQKLNTKSSTESELVGVSDYLPYIIWAMNFLAYLGYPVKNTTLFQDNQSTIKMEKNGRRSCTSRSRHIDIRYFFVKDRVDNGDIDIQYCPTDEMLGDFYTKPLQGKLFENQRKVIMGWEPVSHLRDLKERVVENMKPLPSVQASVSRM